MVNGQPWKRNRLAIDVIAEPRNTNVALHEHALPTYDI
jgi:hypothetical protein